MNLGVARTENWRFSGLENDAVVAWRRGNEVETPQPREALADFAKECAESVSLSRGGGVGAGNRVASSVRM